MKEHYCHDGGNQRQTSHLKPVLQRGCENQVGGKVGVGGWGGGGAAALKLKAGVCG